MLGTTTRGGLVMMDMMSGMGLMMLIGLMLLAIVIGVAVYVGVRAAREPGGARQLTARERLQQRLADGEITPEEYYEREAVLRDDTPAGRRRR